MAEAEVLAAVAVVFLTVVVLLTVAELFLVVAADAVLLTRLFHVVFGFQTAFSSKSLTLTL